MNISRVCPKLRLLRDGKVQIIGGDYDGTMEIYDAGKDVFTGPAHLVSTLDIFSASKVMCAQTRAAFIDNKTQLQENANIKGAQQIQSYSSAVRKALESFDDLFDVTYTARMEGELDDIEEGKLDWRVAMSEFYERFQKDLKHAERHMTDIKRMEEPTDQICEKCGKPMVIKWGRHGKFIACTGYPGMKRGDAARLCTTRLRIEPTPATNALIAADCSAEIVLAISSYDW